MSKVEIPVDTLRALLCGGVPSRDESGLAASGLELAPKGETVITVLDRGFVYVGKTRVAGDFVEITGARNIRVWGTKNGLGELRDGARPETKLDEVGRVVAPMRAVISFISCTRDW
jgi:hypothetical protein